MPAVLLLTSMALASGAAWLVVSELLRARAERAAIGRAASYGRPVQVARPTHAPRRPSIPLVEPLAHVTLRMAPRRDRGKTSAQLQAAGFAPSMVDRLLALKAASALFGLAVGALLGASLGGPATALVLAASCAAAGFAGPDVLLARRASARREQILRSLPNALDLIAVIVEAGLGLDAALARYAETADGPLAQEIALLTTEMRVGASRAAVFRGFAERVPAAETQAFVRAIVTADQLGMSLGRTLRGQAQDARFRRQALAEQRANKAPVKMLFPTVLCIFPALFVAVLGPAILNLLHAR